MCVCVRRQVVGSDFLAFQHFATLALLVTSATGARVSVEFGTWPPRQATGLPRSSAGVGVGMLRGVGDYLFENEKVLVSKFVFLYV